MKEEGNIISISTELEEKERKIVPIGLVGKLLSKRFINKFNFCKTLQQIWNISSELEIRIIADNTLFFKLEKKEDIDRILSSEPWSYNRALLLLKI